MTDSARLRALELAVGRFMELPAILDAAHKFAEFIHSGTVGATEHHPKGSAAPAAETEQVTKEEPVKRAEDRVPKDPPKRTSRQVGKPAPAAASAAETTTATTASPSKPLTLDDVRAQLVLVQTKAGNKDAVFALIKKHSKDGTHTLSALEQPKFGNVIADAKAYLAS